MFLHYTYNGVRIDGFRKLDPARGIDDDMNSFFILQIEDTFEIWETELFSHRPGRQDTIRDFFNWVVKSGYVEDPKHIVRYYVVDIDVVNCYNRSWRASTSG